MASRVVAQLIINGASIFTRAFINAYQQALRNAKTGGAANATARAIKLKMQPDEAMHILNIEKAELSVALVEERYKKLFESNDPAKGGSFYLQSKVFRSREALIKSLTSPEEAAAAAAGAERDTNAAPGNAENKSQQG